MELEDPLEYCNLEDVFSKKWTTKHGLYRPWDCAIDFLPGHTPPHSQIYPSLSRNYAAKEKDIMPQGRGSFGILCLQHDQASASWWEKWWRTALIIEDSIYRLWTFINPCLWCRTHQSNCILNHDRIENDIKSHLQLGRRWISSEVASEEWPRVHWRGTRIFSGEFIECTYK